MKSTQEIIGKVFKSDEYLVQFEPDHVKKPNFKIPFKKKFKKLIRHKVSRDSFLNTVGIIDKPDFEEYKTEHHEPNKFLINKFENICSDLNTMIEREITAMNDYDGSIDANREQLLLMASEIKSKIIKVLYKVRNSELSL